MFRKKLTPSAVRRCAVFLTVGGAIGLGISQAPAGIAPVTSGSSASVDAVGLGNASPQLTDPSDVIGQEPGVSAISTASRATNDSGPAIAGPEDLTGPGLTGSNWYQNLQVGVDQAFNPSNVVLSDQGANTGTAVARPMDLPASGVKANAIPSIPSFWSGLTCCLAVMGAGMIPRVRRIFR